MDKAWGRPFERKVNFFWIIGRTIILDVSTPTHPLASAMVDIDQVENLAMPAHRWSAFRGKTKLFYAARSTRTGRHLMHRMVLGYPDGRLHIDHVNGDGLDNRKLNLRTASWSQNMANSHKKMAASSRFKGVCWMKDRRKWAAYISPNRRRIHLGFFVLEEDAARAYDAAAAIYFGEFSCPNFTRDHP